MPRLLYLISVRNIRQTDAMVLYLVLRAKICPFFFFSLRNLDCTDNAHKRRIKEIVDVKAVYIYTRESVL